MAFRFNPTTGQLDLVGAASGIQPQDMEFDQTGFIMTAGDGSRWRVTINAAGVIQTTLIPAAPPSGGGPWLSLGLTLFDTV